MKNLVLTLAALLAMATPAFAQAPSKEKMTAVGNTYLQCAIFYEVSRDCLGKYAKTTDDKKVTANLEQSSAVSLRMAATAYNQAGQPADAFNSQKRILGDDMKKLTKNDCKNTPVLIEKYGPTCKTAVESPETYLKSQLGEAATNAPSPMPGKKK